MSYIDSCRDKILIIKNNNIKNEDKFINEPAISNVIASASAISIDKNKSNNDEEIKKEIPNQMNVYFKNKSYSLENKNALLKNNNAEQKNVFIKIDSNSENGNKIKAQENYSDINPKKNEINTNNTKDNKFNSRNKPNYNCLSLKIEESIPTSMREFGKFIIKYTERDENYKVFLENNIKKISKNILLKFKKDNRSDHCLLDLLIELWDKLEISYQRRNKLLTDFINNFSSHEIYNLLDKETEILSDFYVKSGDIYKCIINRERKKSIIQAKINRSKNLYFIYKMKLLAMISKNLKNLLKKFLLGLRNLKRNLMRI
jgi:hypothetical protein